MKSQQRFMDFIFWRYFNIYFHFFLNDLKNVSLALLIVLNMLFAKKMRWFSTSIKYPETMVWFTFSTFNTNSIELAVSRRHPWNRSLGKYNQAHNHQRDSFICRYKWRLQSTSYGSRVCLEIKVSSWELIRFYDLSTADLKSRLPMEWSLQVLYRLLRDKRCLDQEVSMSNKRLTLKNLYILMM